MSNHWTAKVQLLYYQCITMAPLRFNHLCTTLCIVRYIITALHLFCSTSLENCSTTTRCKQDNTNSVHHRRQNEDWAGRSDGKKLEELPAVMMNLAQEGGNTLLYPSHHPHDSTPPRRDDRRRAGRVPESGGVHDGRLRQRAHRAVRAGHAQGDGLEARYKGGRGVVVTVWSWCGPFN